MKRILLFALITLVGFGLKAQFTPSGNNLYHSIGKVGIGTSNPDRLLDIKGSHSTSKFRVWYDDRATDDSRIATIDIWASEPGISYSSAGIGYNINKSSYYGVFDNINGASAIRFFQDGSIRFHTLAPGGSQIAYGSPGMFISANANIGIGTTNPVERLQIGNLNNADNLKIKMPGVYNFEQIKLGQYGNGSCGLELINHTNVNDSYGVRLYTNTDNGIAGLQIQTATPTNSYESLNYITRLAINTSGNVGIGTTDPNAKLTIEGGAFNFNVTSNYGGDYPTDNANYSNVLAIGGIGAETGLKIFKQNSGSSPTFLGATNYTDTYVFEMTDANDADPDGGIIFGATGNDDVFENIMTIRGNKRVGIGTTNPQSLLAVNGIITSKEVNVTLDGWSDFVFEQDYNLPTLEEVEQYIKTHKHLPDVPSEKEVKENGLSLGKSDAVLLQKVEELTLYAISQNKEVKRLKKIDGERLMKIEMLEKEAGSQKMETKQARAEIERLKKIEEKYETQQAMLEELIKRIEKLELKN